MRRPVLLLCLAFTLGLSGCQGEDPPLVEVNLDTVALGLAPGESRTLQATVYCSYTPCEAALSLATPTLPDGVSIAGLDTPQRSDNESSAGVWTITVSASPQATGFDGSITFSVRPTDGQSFESRLVQIVEASLALSVSGPPGSAPVARFGYSPASPAVGQPIAFDATASTGSIASYRWDFGADGSVEATGPAATYSFGVAGAWPVRLQLVGADGTVAEVTQTLQVVGGGSGGTAVLTLSFTGNGRGGVTFTPATTACSRDGEPVCARDFPAESTVLLKGFAYEGSRLAGWGPGCSRVGPAGDECTVFMDGNRQITLQID